MPFILPVPHEPATVEAHLAKCVRVGDCLIPSSNHWRINGTVYKAKRVVWTHKHGPIPDGMAVYRICPNQADCVEISHLVLKAHARASISGEKRCAKCGHAKPLAEFNRDASVKSGLHSRCKRCHREAGHEWRADNREYCEALRVAPDRRRCPTCATVFVSSHVRKKYCELKCVPIRPFISAIPKRELIRFPQRAQSPTPSWRADNPTDLLQRAQQGDIEARNKLVVLYADLVPVVIAERFVFTLDDFTQEGLLGLIEAIETWAPDTDFRAYAQQNIYDAILANVRDQPAPQKVMSLHKRIGPGDGIECIDLLPDTGPAIEDFVIESERTAVLREVVSALPERDRQIVIRHFGLDGGEPSSCAEIASEFGLLVTAIEARLSTALTQLASAPRLREALA